MLEAIINQKVMKQFVKLLNIYKNNLFCKTNNKLIFIDIFYFYLSPIHIYKN